MTQRLCARPECRKAIKDIDTAHFVLMAYFHERCCPACRKDEGFMADPDADGNHTQRPGVHSSYGTDNSQ